MKTKLITGLALAVAILISQPAFAHGGKRGGGGGHHAVAAAHHSGGRHHAVASSHRGSRHFRTASRHVSVHRSFHATRIARRGNVRARTYTAANSGRAGRVNRSHHINRASLVANAHRGRNNIAFGGSSRYSGTRNGGNNHGTYAFASHAGWNHGHEYYWHGHHYRWYGNGWYMLDLYPFAAGYYYGPGYNSDSLAVQVQQDLEHDGYYEGPIDGIVGPVTSNAIAAYQQDNGLPVTGAINGPLLQSMGL